MVGISKYRKRATHLREKIGALNMFLFRHIFPKTTFIKVTKNILAHNFTPDEIKKIIAQFYEHQLSGQIPKCESAGVCLLLKLACLNSALYQALLSHQVKKSEALYYLENIQWEFTNDIAWLIFRLSGLAGRDAQKRLKWIDRFVWKFLFTNPFQRVSLSMDETSISFKVIRCPIADYFQTINQIELCRSAFCNLYYHWAELMGVTLDRRQTLATGAPICDFRFQVDKVLEQRIPSATGKKPAEAVSINNFLLSK